MTALVDVERALDAYLAAIGCRCGGPVIAVSWSDHGDLDLAVEHEDPACPGAAWARTPRLVNVPTGDRL